LLILQIFANYNLVEPENREHQGYAISFNWFFKDEIYNQYGKWACKSARIIWILSLPLITFWLMY